MTTEARRAAVFARSTTATLFQTVETLESLRELSAEQKLARRWALEEIERRHPEVEAEMEQWASGDAPLAEYSAALKRAVSASGVRV